MLTSGLAKRAAREQWPPLAPICALESKILSVGYWFFASCANKNKKPTKITTEDPETYAK